MFRSKLFYSARQPRFLRIRTLPTQQQEFSTSPYPFRAGYGLGSWIPPKVYHGMVNEGIHRSKVTTLDQVLIDLESTLRELELQKNAFGDGVQVVDSDESSKEIEELKKQISEAWSQKVNALTELFKEQLSSAQSIQATDKSAYEAGATSPIKWETSKIIYPNRSSDSMTIDAHFFTHDSDNQDVHRTAKDMSAAAVGSASTGIAKINPSGVGEAVYAKQVKAMANQKLESTLLLVAKATHAGVMQFENAVFDEMLLKDAWNHYNSNAKQLTIESLAPTDLDPSHTSSENDDGVHMISECFLGSCFIGMVHFVKNESGSRSGLTDAEAKKMGVRFSLWLGAVTGDTDISKNHAKAAADAVSNLGLDLKFDLMSLGYCPSVSSNTLQTTIESFKNFDPANFRLEGSDNLGESDKGNAVHEEEERAQGRREALRQSNMKAVIQATIKGVEETLKWKVLDLTTFMNAFDDYTKNAKKSQGGIPVGINVRSWYRHQIALLLWRKYVVPTDENANTAQPSTSSAPSGQ